MIRTTHFARTSALPAIAAALALSSTPLLAQATQPVTTEPAPVVTQQAPPPVTDATPVAPDTSAAPATDSTTAPSTTTTTRTRHTARSARIAAPKATTVSTVTRTQVTRHAAVPATPAAPAATSAPNSTATPTANSGPAVAPVVDMAAKPAKQPPPPPSASTRADETLPIAGGALALLALGGAAFAVSRRRRRREDAWHDNWQDEPAMEPETAAAAEAEPRHDPIVHDEQPEIAAPSAFAWGASAPTQQRADGDSGDDRLPGETWVQRAYRGPSANNPSASLKARLRRAAFFDKRERDVAAGIAEPVDADAGLPDGVADEQDRALA